MVGTESTYLCDPSGILLFYSHQGLYGHKGNNLPWKCFIFLIYLGCTESGVSWRSSLANSMSGCRIREFIVSSLFITKSFVRALPTLFFMSCVPQFWYVRLHYVLLRTLSMICCLSFRQSLAEALRVFLCLPSLSESTGHSYGVITDSDILFLKVLKCR